MKCLFCKKEIELGESVYKMTCGSLKKDDMGGINFEDAKSIPVHGCIHFNCVDGLRK